MSDQELPARAYIESQYARLSEAVRMKDLEAIRALYAPEYRELQISGEERDLAEVMAEWRDDLAEMIEPTLQTVIDHFDLDDGEASVTASSAQDFIDAPNPSLRYHNRIETMRRDFWLNAGAGWRLDRSERQTTRWWIDGKLNREAAFVPPLTAEQRAAVMRDLRARIIPFDSVLAGSGFDDLAGLDRVIGDARIVALGEASHGTAEFFQMKHRLLEYLVERKGFTVFAIEGNWPEAQLADRFVKTGESDAAAALAAMYFWTWQTEEVAALLNWMRHYNTTPGERPVLSFTGFDMQFPQVAAKRVIELLDRAGSAEQDAVRALYDAVEKLERGGSEIPAAEYARLADGAGKAIDLIEARRQTLERALSAEEYRELRQAARVVLQALQMRADMLERDRAMAENVRWLAEEAFPGQKIVLWAHNGHVGTKIGGSEKTLGDHLRERYSNQMIVMGFSTDHGSVRAWPVKEGRFQPGPAAFFPLAPASSVSVEAVFAETGVPRFILDLRDLPTDSAVGAWLAKPRPHRTIGAVYDPDRASTFYEHLRLPETYDSIVFIAESKAAKPLK
jgi:erythromycin esterase